MTILSDRQIKKLCLPPETVFDNEGYMRELSQVHVAPSGVPASKEYWDSVYKKYERKTTQEERDAFVPMISDFRSESVKEITRHTFEGKTTFKTLSYGLSSYGYDVRLDAQFKIFTNVNCAEIDPKRISQECMVDGILRTAKDGSEYVLLPPNSYLLGVTMEYFIMPRDILGICVGKSTMARSAVAINVTPIEPGFSGRVVVEVANQSSLPVRIYAFEGIGQVIFLQGTESCEVSYADRAGKYNFQNSLQLPKV